MPLGIARLNSLAVPLPNSLAFITSNSNVQSGTSGVTASVTASVGDLIIFFTNAANANAPPTLITPSGFTIAKDLPSPTQSASTRVVVGYQVATTSGSRSITSTGGSGGSSHILLVYRPTASITSVSFNTGTSQATTATPVNQTLTFGTMTPLTVAFAGFGSTGGLASGSAGAVSGATATRTISAIFSSTYNRVITFEGAGFSGTGTASMSDGGSNTMFTTVMTVA
jgi:hypothetical protein